MHLSDDWNRDVPEWAGVPPEQVEGERRGGGWMKMDGSGKERFIGNFTTHNWAAVGTACVRYIAVSCFQNETNTVRYCRAQALLRSEKGEDVARGETMMKNFFSSDDTELKMLAMECCIKRGISTLDDFGGMNAAKRLRYAAIERGETQVLERLAVGDSDPEVRKAAYECMTNPPPLVSAKYIVQIRADDSPGDISKPLKAIRALNDQIALKFIVRNAQLGFFQTEAQKRLDELGDK